MKLWKPALIASLVLAACAQKDPATLVASAKQYIAKRDYPASIIQLKNALQKDPNNGEARYLLGLASLESGDISSAEIELGKASALGYRGEELRVATARMLLAKGEYAKLTKEYDRGKLSSAQLEAQLLAVIGSAHLAQNQRAEAESTLAQAITLDPSSTLANMALARTAASAGNLPAALKHVDQALAAAPGNFEALLLKADLLALQGQNAAAEKAYRDAVAARPNLPGPRLALITHLLRNGSVDKASTEATEMEKAAPKDARTAYAKALVYSEQRNYVKAHESIQQVLKVMPNHAPSLLLAGMAALEMRNYPEAESHLRKAVQVAPNSIAARRLLASAHLRMGQSEVALGEAKALLEQAPDHPQVAALAADAFLANGDIATAARQYERAKSLAPENATVQTRLALVRLAAGDNDRGVKELEAASATHRDDYQADLALVTTYLGQRKPDAALAALKNLESKQPNNPLTHNLRGFALVLKRDFAGARKSFERAVELNPTYMPAIGNLVQLDLQDRKTEAAKARYENVLKKEPSNEQALSGLAVILRITGAPKEDIERLLKRAIAAAPTSPRSRVALTEFYLRNRDFPKALGAAQEAQAALPNDSTMAQLLGRTQLAAGESRQAVATFQRVVEMRPKDPQPLVDLARAQHASNQVDNAIQSLRAALKLQPDLATVERDIAALYASTGRYAEAMAEARAVQKRSPNQPLGYVLEAETQLAQKNLPAAERTYRAAVKKFDVPALVIRTHAVMTAAGNGAEADASAQKWVDAHDKDVTVLVYLGQRDLAAKRFDEAEKRYRQAHERAPNNPIVLNNLAWVSNELKRADALEFAERANQKAPDNPVIMDTLAMILVDRGEIERALQLLGRASEIAPQVHEIRLNLARALVKAGRKDAARKELETLVKLDSKLPVQQQASALLATL